MKKLLFTLLLIPFLQSCGTTNEAIKQFDNAVVDVACGKCMFDMTGESCDLAVKLNDKYYYVEGTEMHELGDEHAEDGMCNVVRQANVTGEIKHGVFVAERVELIPVGE